MIDRYNWKLGVFGDVIDEAPHSSLWGPGRPSLCFNAEAHEVVLGLRTFAIRTIFVKQTS